MIFCFSLTFCRLVKSRTPSFPSFPLQPPLQPTSPVHPSFIPSAHLPTWWYPSTPTTSLTRSPTQPPHHHPPTCSATIHLSVPSPTVLFTHPPTPLPTLHHPFHPTICLSISPCSHSPGSQPATLHPSSSVSSCPSIYLTFDGSLPVPGPVLGELLHVQYDINCHGLMTSTPIHSSLGKRSPFPTSLTAPKVTTVPSVPVLYVHLHFSFFRL